MYFCDTTNISFVLQALLCVGLVFAVKTGSVIERTGPLLRVCVVHLHPATAW
jgi:hypothetical protein